MGLLAPGMFADMTVLAPNPFTLDAEDIQQAQVQVTYVGGRIVYERQDR